MIAKKLSKKFKSLVTKQAFTKITICLAMAIAWSMAWGSFQIAYGNDAWYIALTRFRVSDAQEEGFFSTHGDEPYFIMVSFRSRFNTPDSTSTWTNDYAHEYWNGLDDGNERDIPVSLPTSMGFTGFANVQRVSLQNIQRGVMPELIGALVLAMEKDNTPWSSIRSMVRDIRNAIERESERLIESGRLNLLNPGPDIQEAIQNILNSVMPDFWEAVGAVIEAAGDPDDLIGYYALTYAAVDNTVPIDSLSGPGYTFRRLAAQDFSLNSNPLVFRGDGATYRVAAQVGIFRMVFFAPGHADATKPNGKLAKSWGGIKTEH